MQMMSMHQINRQLKLLNFAQPHPPECNLCIELKSNYLHTHTHTHSLIYHDQMSVVHDFNQSMLIYSFSLDDWLYGWMADAHNFVSVIYLTF